MAEERKSNGVRVCVTGGAGFIGSWLVKKLLEKGYTVHATLRNTGDEEKAGLLQRLVPGAADRLRLFEADLFDAATFAPAIAGCRFVFLVATPYGLESARSKYKNTAEAAVDAVRVILRQCAESRTVKRVIHTASISTASPLNEVSGARGYKDSINESCWTRLDVDYPLRSAHFDKYILSKLQSERELLRYNDSNDHRAFEVVTLPLGLVAGDTVLGRVPETLESAVSPVSRNAPCFGFLRLLQRLLGSVPLVHVDDVCDALVFCAERPSVAGRFLCAAAFPTVHDVVDHYANKFPHLDVLKETEAVSRVQPDGNRLGELGFRYKYGLEEILDSSVACAERLGYLDVAKIRLQTE